MMKKSFAILLAVSMLFTLAACGNNALEKETQSSTENSSASTAPEQQANENTSGTGKTLVVYFSATGNTKQVAEYIVKATNADVFELEPKDAYTSEDLNWTNDNSRVCVEHEDESKRDISLVETTPDNFSDYDTVYIGYPIWWGIAAWPVDNFIKANNFTGKTVIPFCTSSSSGLGESGDLLKEMSGTGNWLEGERFSSSSSESEVTAWVNSLGI